MKRLLVLTLAAAVLLCCVGCEAVEKLLFPLPPTTPTPDTRAPGETAAPQDGETAAPAVLSGEDLLEAEDGTTLVHYQAELPLFSPDEGVLAEINSYYRQEYSGFVDTVEGELRMISETNLEAHRLTGSEYVACEARQTYEITRRDDRFISVSRIIAMSFGAETVESYRKGDTFSAKTGARLRLSDVFRVPSEEYLPLLRDLVADQIRALQETDTTGRYYDGAADRVEEFLMEDNFWLTGQTLVLFFPEGTLGPVGTESFHIAYTDISDLLTEGIQ